MASKRATVSVAAVVIPLLAVAGIGLFLFLEREARKPAPPPPALSAEAKAYVRHLKLADVEMKAHESYLKQSVVEITGKISNAGDRVLQIVELNCVFYDAYGQVVLRERVPIVNRKMGNLSPGETKTFRLAFDDVPESWSQAMPQLVIAAITFA